MNELLIEWQCVRVTHEYCVNSVNKTCKYVHLL